MTRVFLMMIHVSNLEVVVIMIWKFHELSGGVLLRLLELFAFHCVYPGEVAGALCRGSDNLDVGCSFWQRNETLHWISQSHQFQKFKEKKIIYIYILHSFLGDWTHEAQSQDKTLEIIDSCESCWLLLVFFPSTVACTPWVLSPKHHTNSSKKGHLVVYDRGYRSNIVGSTSLLTEKPF